MLVWIKANNAGPKPNKKARVNPRSSPSQIGFID
jgi:hypothetical protein